MIFAGLNNIPRLWTGHRLLKLTLVWFQNSVATLRNSAGRWRW
jgi:hypothetical protein